MQIPISRVNCPGRRGRVRAFTLVEIMVVVVIIGLLAALAIPAFARVREASRISRFTNDLRVFAQAFETYALEHGEWPADSAPGEVPANMTGEVAAAWLAVPIVGGLWEWDGEANVKMITAYHPTADEAFMLKVDARIDDGDPNTGTFRKNGTEWNYILAETP